MAAGRTVEDILSGAKETLSKANALSDSVNAEADKSVPRPAPHLLAPPKHEFSHAPYSLAREASDTGKGLKSRMEMEAKARKAL